MAEIGECEIKVVRAEGHGLEQMMMIPVQKNGSLPLKTLSVYIEAEVSGLKYKPEQSSPWFFVRIDKEGNLVPKEGLWSTDYVYVAMLRSDASGQKDSNVEADKIEFKLGDNTPNDSDENSLLLDAVNVTLTYLNSRGSKEILVEWFKIASLERFAQHLSKTIVRFEVEKVPFPQSALSWILPEDLNTILINVTFLDRYKETKDEKEKRRIVFMVGILIFHEIGHIALQLGNCKTKFAYAHNDESGKPKRKKTFNLAKVMPEGAMGEEAGFFFEDRVLAGIFGPILPKSVKEDSKWHQTYPIDGVGFKAGGARNYELIHDDYMSAVIKGEKRHVRAADELLAYKFDKKTKTKEFASRHVILRAILETDEPGTPTHCGTHRYRSKIDIDQTMA